MKEKISFLKKIQENLNTQDNRCTADPIFIVYDWERIPSSHYYSDEWMFVDSEGKIAEDEEELINFLKESECCGKISEEELKDMTDTELLEWIKKKGVDDIEQVYYIKKKVFINVFFTEEAANSFIKQNYYHYTDEVHTYVNCLWRNPEMQHIRNCLEKGLFSQKPEESLKKK